MRRRSFTFVVIVAVTGLALSSTAFATHDFPDVPDSNPFHDDISWLADAGITTGFPDGTYRPGDPVTRGSMAAFMRRLAGADPDVDPVVDAATVGGVTANLLRQQGGIFELSDVVVVGTTSATATPLSSDFVILEDGIFVMQVSGMVNTASDSALLSCVSEGAIAFPGLTDMKVGDTTAGYSDRFPFSAQHRVVAAGPTNISVSCYVEAAVGAGSTVIVDPVISVIQVS
jgi:hypothetical protein